MSSAALLVLAAGVLTAYWNGANDVSKGIATLVGSGVTDYRRAIGWGAFCTGLGGLAGAGAAGAMLVTFGTGVLAPGTAPTSAAALATILGAAAWVLVATRTGLPVSTTHAIVGALAGVGALAYGLGGVRWTALGATIVVPLLLSPLASLVLTALILRTARGPAAALAAEGDCVCAGLEPAGTAIAAADAWSRTAALVADGWRVQISAGASKACATERPSALRLRLDHLHWVTSGATSFARGMNDAPKIVAITLAAAALAGGAAVSLPVLFALITLGMVAGSVAGGRRVTHVLAERITRMDHQEGFVANLVTAALVGAGAIGGLPMSTTHVASSAIVGAGAQRGRAALNRRTIRDVLLAWVVTVPAAATFGVLALVLLRQGS